MKRIAMVTLAGLALAGLTVPAAAASAATGSVTVSVVLSGLNSPRTLSYTPLGLTMVQAGAGGPEDTANCVTAENLSGTGQTQFCAGLTGSVSLISNDRVVASQPEASVMEEDDQEAAGPGGVAFGSGEEAVVEQDILVNSQGVNPIPAPYGADFGTVVLHTAHGTITANVAAFAAANPQPASSLGDLGEAAYDSDPYAIAAYHGGFAVTDAAANSLFFVSATGQIHLLARFPTDTEVAPVGTIGNTSPVTIEAQAVPTGIAVGPDGALYVGTLRGIPSNPGTSQIYRVVPGQAPTVWASGLTAISAIAFDSQGRLLATEYSTGGALSSTSVPGALLRITNGGKTVTTLPVTLYQPNGVAVAPDGTIYVTNYGDNSATSANPGELLQVKGL